MINKHRDQITEQEILDLLPGYVMGILEPDELLLVDDYLHDFPHIGLRIAELEETTAALAFAAPAALPPQSSKVGVLQRAAESMASQAAPSQAAPQQVVPEPINVTQHPLRAAQRSAARQTSDAALGFELIEEATRWWQRAIGWKIATGFAAAAAVALLTILLQQQVEVDGIRSEMAAVRQDLAALQSESEALSVSNEGLAAQVSAQVEMLAAQQEALAAQDLAQQVQTTTMLSAQRAVFLGGTDDAPLAGASLFIDAENSGTLVLRGLDPLPAEQTYQLWLIPDDGTPVPAGLFAVDDAASSLVTLNLPVVEQGFTTVGISIEPAAGSPAPTGPIVLLGT